MKPSDVQPNSPPRAAASRRGASRPLPTSSASVVWSRARAPGIATRTTADHDVRGRVPLADPVVDERSLRDVEDRLHRKSQLLDAILAKMVQGLMLVNEDHIVEVCNQRAIELLGLPPALMARRPHFVEVLEYQWSTDDFAHTPEELKRFVREGGILDQPQCYERMRPDGRVIEVQSVPLPAGGVLRTYTDITERRRGEERIRYRARHDGLTSLLNRDAFIELLGETIMKTTHEGGSFAVHYVDLDGFKPVNDALGHGGGDRVLAAVAQRLLGVARDGDTVARMGGDEFAILQHGVGTSAQAVGLADRMRHALETPIEVESRTVRVGLSAGIAIFPRHGVTPEALLRNADAALYRVKSAGGSNVRVSDIAS